ncbi:hypothetical protein ACFOSC_21560 [Streptantibioticus rubrisoli]|uniref:Uncharacterized protein n=1 Tax=Streptantibioticus rubrisoli TaxID=1387313 RepID=A0ABT1P823_9ACTN|nr:hypothetical protein [Streptantibioticus rubrisoli]MCQ4040548.1 hypothetical protein [Streptantibioticus rubrisoli]
MTREQITRLIGGAFGLVFVEVDAGALPSPASVALRVLAVAAFLGLAVALRRARPAGSSGAGRFGREYWLVVALEVVAGVAGIVVIKAALHAPQATVAWISFVVGLHFLGLAVVWRRPRLHWLAAGLTACGAAGLALAGCGCPAAAIAATAGVVPGRCCSARCGGVSSRRPRKV